MHKWIFIALKVCSHLKNSHIENISNCLILEERIVLSRGLKWVVLIMRPILLCLQLIRSFKLVEV